MKHLKNAVLFLTILLLGMTKGLSQVTVETYNLEKTFVDSNGKESSLYEKKSTASITLNNEASYVSISCEVPELNGSGAIILKETTTDEDGLYLNGIVKLNGKVYAIHIQGEYKTILIEDASRPEGEGFNTWNFFNYCTTNRCE